jgi:hypothetical protein
MPKGLNSSDLEIQNNILLPFPLILINQLPQVLTLATKQEAFKTKQNKKPPGSLNIAIFFP